MTEYKYYSIPGVFSASFAPSDEDKKEAGTKTAVFDSLQKLSLLEKPVYSSDDIFLYSRVLKLLSIWSGSTAFPSDIVYFSRVFCFVPVFLGEGASDDKKIAMGAFMEGIIAAKSTGADEYHVVMVSTDQLISLAGLHYFFVKNMQIAQTAPGLDKIVIELTDTFNYIFDADFRKNIISVRDTLKQASSAAYSVTLQFAKVMCDCDISTPESVARFAQRYDDLIDGIYKPVLIMRS